MILKEIKQGMAIHCTERKHIEYLTENGFAKKSMVKNGLPIWIAFFDEDFPSRNWMPEVSDISGISGREYYENSGLKCVEFNDLILLELSPEEVLEIRNELSFDFVREYLGLCYGDSTDEMLREASPKQIIDMCKKWKADHEKKEPEVEWVYKGVADIAVCNEIEFFNTEEVAKEWCERRTIETGHNHAYIPVCRVKE